MYPPLAMNAILASVQPAGTRGRRCQSQCHVWSATDGDGLSSPQSNWTAATCAREGAHYNTQAWCCQANFTRGAAAQC